ACLGPPGPLAGLPAGPRGVVRFLTRELIMQVVLDGVSRSFGGSQALAGVDLEIGPGITGLLGPNGAGKTTFLRILATVLAPSHGSVKVGSWNPARPADRTQVRRQLGYL